METAISGRHCTVIMVNFQLPVTQKVIVKCSPQFNYIWLNFVLPPLQGYSLAVSLLMVIVNLVYLEPQTTKCTFAKHKFEKEINAGNAIGKLEKDKQEQLRKNPQYPALESSFIRLHSYASVANLVALAAQTVHLWYLSCKLTSI